MGQKWPHPSAMTSNKTISASFLNNVESVFLRQSGDNENGKYLIEGGAFATGCTNSQWISTVSRTTPLSCSIDTTTALVGYGAPVTANIDKSGVAIQSNSTGISNTARWGGNYTFNY